MYACGVQWQASRTEDEDWPADVMTGSGHRVTEYQFLKQRCPLAGTQDKSGG